MTTRIKFHGIAAFEIVGPNYRFLIDPCLTGNPHALIGPDDLETPDVILVTHAAWDHLGDTLSIAKRTGAPVVCSPDVRLMLVDQGLPPSQIRATVWGIVVEVGGVRIRPVESHHLSIGQLSSESYVTGIPLGFIVETEPGVRIYHCGDTAIFGDMRLIGELYRPTVGLLGCAIPDVPSPFERPGTALTGEMSPAEAVLAAELLGVRLAVACHYTHVSDSDAQEFLALMREKNDAADQLGLALIPGQTLVVGDGPHTVEDE